MKTGKNLAKLAAQGADDKKALDIRILDLRKFNFIADYFVIASGTSNVHCGAIADGIEEKLREDGSRVFRREADSESRWTLLDYGDLIAHVFHEEARKYYALDKLWGEAPSEDFLPAKKKKPAKVTAKLRVKK